jgi:pSer/pThr/pTyr-binding forkhead associated (FHA) protein
MGIRLSVRPRERSEDGSQPLDALYELDQDRILIGRGAGADVRLPHASVSVRHATIEQRGGRYIIVDHGTTNGTQVQGVRIVPERPKVLRDGDQVAIGAFVLAWKEGVPISSSPTVERTASLARRLLRGVLGPNAPEGARITVTNGADQGRTLAIPPPPARLLIGRGETCDLLLADADASREHVELIVDLDGVIARDRSSKNGLLVNQRRVSEKRLCDRDELLIGSTLIVFDDPVDSALVAAEIGPDIAIAPPISEAIAPAQTVTLPEDDPDAPTGEPELTSTPEPPLLHEGHRRRAVSSAELFIYVLAALVFSASVAGFVFLLRAS